MAITLIAVSDFALAAGCRHKTVAEKVAADGFSAAVSTAAKPAMLSEREHFKVDVDTAPALPGYPVAPTKPQPDKMRFFNPQLAAIRSIRRSRYQHIGLAGTDDESTSSGHHWHRVGHHSPTVFNAASNSARYQDRRAADFEARANGSMVNPVDIRSPQPQVAEQLKGVSGCRESSAQAVPGEADARTAPGVELVFDNKSNTCIYRRDHLGDVTAKTVRHTSFAPAGWLA